MIATMAAMTRTSMIQLAVSLVLLMTFAQRSAARSLLQGSTCSGPIPQCETNRCYLQPVAGRMQNVCERCQPGYNVTDNGLNCICKAGTWHSCSGSTCSCKLCDKAMFCPGGARQAQNYAPENLKGLRLSCEQAVEVSNTSSINTAAIEANGLSTKVKGAKRPQDCFPLPGFYLAAVARGSQKAALCPNATYSQGWGRLRQCLKCQSGTQENPAIAYAANLADLPTKRLRTNRTDVCQVGPGRYLVQNVVRDCPAGSFRTSYDRTIDSGSRYCFTCPPGVTTNGTQATKQTDCNVVVAGVLLNMTDLTSAQALAAQGNNSLADNLLTLCPYGTYWEGGVLTAATGSTCKPCPFGTTTQFLGASSINDCQIPPGYYVNITSTSPTLEGDMKPCPVNVSGQGYYRAGWISYSDIKAQDSNGTTACTPCGPGILSAPTDIDEIGGGNDTSKLVAGSSYSCWIPAGWGMVPSGVLLDNTMQYSAVECANNTYGVANVTYGLQSTPCKPCQRNLITLQPASTNYTQCVNPEGYGYSPGGATVCAPGTYTSQGSMQGCIACPAGRTTADNSTLQTAITDCIVIPGYGVYNGTNGTAPWDPPTSSLSPAAKANLTVMPCPVGYYGEGGQLDSKCLPCNGSRTTQGEGSSSVAQCDRCPAGLQFTSGTGSCSACPAGTYQPGYLGNDAGGANFGAGTTCLTCPKTRSVYISSKGNETEYESDPITYRKGAASRDECVPKDAQLGIDVGTMFFDIPASDTLLTSVTTTPIPSTPEACVTAACGSTNTCCFVQFDYAYRKNGSGGPAAKSCKYVKMTPNLVASPPSATATDSLVFYKMLPSDAIAAASLSTAAGKLEAKAMSSGLYARCTLPTDWAADDVYNSQGKMGKVLATSPALPAATNAAGLAECKKRCDMMSICWGFTVRVGQCTLRGGFDEMDVRSFFRNPMDPTVQNW